MLFQSLRGAFRSLPRNTTCRNRTLLLSQHRNFSQTRAWRATEDIDTFATRYQNTALFKKLADKPAALAALNNFAQILKDEGIDITSGQPPSKTQMFKLAMSPKFRDGAKKVVVELQNAGIDLSSKEAMEELTNFAQWSKK
ncbi:hypothetical protein BJ322DRAFT_1112957 [Thelephora terrestris]|uniref:Uncharacterized protein n=1 Tax=Thelephora terrestris TaxID=56493 RepID=A0A9P6H959_9AGAM|nr:hypothetical protein BJ322DRAFT_1112957 [Thelephora terrestris]